MSDQIRYALIGAGSVGGVHGWCINALPQFDLVAVVDPDKAAAEHVAEKYGSTPLSSIADLEDLGIEAVSVAVPPLLHLPVGEECLGRGWHVMMEKPLELSVERAEALVAAAEERDLILGVCHQYRLHTWAKKVKSMLDQGEIGDILHVDWTLFDPRPDAYYERHEWKADTSFPVSGILANQAGHAVDNLIHFLGEPVEVRGILSRQLHTQGGPDAVAAQLRFASGALATLNWSINSATDSSIRQFVGTKGFIRMTSVRSVSINVDDPIQIGYFDAEMRTNIRDGVVEPVNVRWWPSRRAKYSRKIGRRIKGKLGLVKPISLTDAHRELLHHFGRAIRGQGSPIVTGRDGLRVIKVLEAIAESAANPAASIELKLADA